MHWELWALNTGNLIRNYDTEAEALATARAFLADGWSVNDLGLHLDFDEGGEGDDDQLPPALYGASLRERLTEVPIPGIERTPGVCGGSARIRKFRIPVWLLEQMRRLGVTEADMLDAYPSLTAEDLVNAWACSALSRRDRA
jgi:uncharacterized protein (DUF433 family)